MIVLSRFVYGTLNWGSGLKSSKLSTIQISRPLHPILTYWFSERWSTFHNLSDDVFVLYIVRISNQNERDGNQKEAKYTEREVTQEAPVTIPILGIHDSEKVVEYRQGCDHHEHTRDLHTDHCHCGCHIIVDPKQAEGKEYLNFPLSNKL